MFFEVLDGNIMKETNLCKNLDLYIRLFVNIWPCSLCFLFQLCELLIATEWSRLGDPSG